MRTSSTLIVVFAKAPKIGGVKTRLSPAIGPKAAARLHLRMLDRVLRTAVSAGCGPVELHGTPANHAFLQAIARRHGVPLHGQVQGDVGVRMHHAFRRGLRRHRNMLLVGTDCPVLTVADLRRAAHMLPGRDAVLMPAEDGGYPLIGLSRTATSLFHGVAWSTSSVMDQTRERLHALGWRWSELRTVWDVDRPEDLARLKMARRLAWRL